MNTINTSDESYQTPSSSKKTSEITGTTGSSLEKSLSQEPLTMDQKIENLTVSQSSIQSEVHNLTLGLIQMIELSNILMKNQIESVNTLVNLNQSVHALSQSVDTKLASLQPSLSKDIKNLSDTLLSAQKSASEHITANQYYLADALRYFTGFLPRQYSHEKEQIQNIKELLYKVK